jgi:signal transduction histidine kinase/ActR/RegA family two-component response regulator
MISAADLLEGLDGPAAVVDAGGRIVLANAAFEALPVADRVRAAEPEGLEWRRRPLTDGRRLVQPDRRGAGAARRADVLATLSHELRTPLNGVLGMAQLLEATALDATQRAYLAHVRECGDHLLGLVGSVLDWARLDAGRIDVEPGAVDLDRLLQGVAELLSPQAHAKGIDIAWAREGDVGAIAGDDGRLRQILFNLAGNAVKMTQTGGVALIARTTPLADGRARLVLEVRDTGPGLSADAQARIFEPFEQTEAGARAGGAGLGLAIARRLAQALNGEVTVESAPGAGAVFAFAMTAAPVAPTQASGRPPLAGRTVGVATPSAVVFQAAALQLQACGAQVIRLDEAADPSAAALDLVLYDAPLGDALPRAVFPAPALALVTPEGRARLPELKGLGYAGWLIKPLRRASLEARARAALGAGDAAPAPPLPVDDDRLQAPGQAGLRVLLAEDNPVNALLARTLLTHMGCRVETAATGDEAVEAGLSTGYDLILMDIRMPGRNGVEAARALRAAGVETKIAALTANAFDDDRRACFDAGMDAFLSKPLDRGALAAVLAACLAAKAA